MKITKRQLKRIIKEAIDPREMEEPLGGWVGDALTNDPDYYHPDDTDNQPRAVGDLVRSVDFRGDGRGGEFKRAVGDEIGTVIEIDDSEDGPVQYLVHWPNGTPTMGSADELEVVNESTVKITKRQLKRIIKEAMPGTIGSGDPAQEILDWAEEGNRVTVAGKNIWAGLGSRSGLHSYADEVVDDKWQKSGDRFTKKVMNMPAGTEVELKRFQSSSRGKGNWVTAGMVTTTGPLKGSGPGGETPSAKRMREISHLLRSMYDRDVKIKSISLYVSPDEPFDGKNWEVVVGRDRMIFPDKDDGRGDYAEWEGKHASAGGEGFWEIYSAY